MRKVQGSMRSETECDRPRSQQGGADGKCEILKAAGADDRLFRSNGCGAHHVAATEDGRTPSDSLDLFFHGQPCIGLFYLVLPCFVLIQLVGGLGPGEPRQMIELGAVDCR